MGMGHYHQTPEGRRRDRKSAKAGDAIWDLFVGSLKAGIKEAKKQEKKRKKGR